MLALGHKACVSGYTAYHISPLTPEQAHVEAVVTAMLDRLFHHSLVFSLKADLYRMKNRMKIGAVGFD